MSASNAVTEGPPVRRLAVPCRTAHPLRAAMLVLALAPALAWAQVPAPAGGAGPGPARAESGAVEGARDAVPAVAAFGVQFGFPAYRTASVSVSLQARFAGFAVRVGGGPAGVSVGLAARAYLPLPLPLPTYVAAGVDAYGGRFAPSVAAGAHVPIAERWRLDLEFGAAWTPLLDELRLTPMLSIGASYAFPLELTPVVRDGAAPIAAPVVRGGAGRCEPGPPDPGALDAALAATIERFVTDAVATYGSVYRDLRYATTAERSVIDGVRATVIVAYDGSVVEILTGRTITAAGSAEVEFRWDGCRWLRTGLRY